MEVIDKRPNLVDELRVGDVLCGYYDHWGVDDPMERGYHFIVGTPENGYNAVDTEGRLFSYNNFSTIRELFKEFVNVMWNPSPLKAAVIFSFLPLETHYTKWKPGDVICYYNNEGKKHYGILIKDDTSDIICGLWELYTGKDISNENTVKGIFQYLLKKYKYFGRVRARLEVEEWGL